MDQMLAMPSEMRRESFLQFWTLKEAYIKAIGDVLAMPLDQFFFDLTPAGPPQLHVRNVTQAGSSWLFAQLRLPSRHHLSLGITHSMLMEKANKQQMRVRVRELKSTRVPIPSGDILCTEKNALYTA